MKVLLVEDEADIRELICLHLEREGCSVEQASDGEAGIQKARGGGFDLYVLDWMLPSVSGLEITRMVRQQQGSGPSILMVTARTDSVDVVAGLEAGADDYVSKPFELPVLMARVRALLRRRTAGRVDTTAIGQLVLNAAAHEVRCGEEAISLTRSEFRLLSSLMQNAGRVMTRQSLIDLVQGEGVSVVDRAIDTHVFGLRKKLGPCGEFIETVRGVGYRMRNNS